MQILFEDLHCVCVAKPAGLLTQGTRGGEPTLEDAVRLYLAKGDPGKAVYVGTVHRLDRPVSGVVLWAKTPKAAHRLSDQFAQRVVKKTYWAITESRVDPKPSGVWDDWLTAVGPAGVARCLTSESAQVKRAITHYRIGHERPGLSEHGLAVVLNPTTGRTHQLRAQSATHLAPILGDVAYGATSPEWRHPGIALHARRIEVEHPILHSPLMIEAPLPEGWPSPRLFV